MEQVNCWELKGCTATDCPVYGHPEKVCWQEPQTLCPQGGEGREKMDLCLECESFRRALAGDGRKETEELFLAELRRRCAEGDEFLREHAAGLSQAYLTLARLCIGETSARLDREPASEVFRPLIHLLNRLGERMETLVNGANELAFGLCEHYETLRRIAGGDFAARAREDSQSELVAKLGGLINAEASALTDSIRELEKAKDELKGQNHFLQVLSDTMPSPVFAKDAEGRYNFCNEAYLALVGRSRAELLGRTVFDLWPEDLARRYHEMDRELFRNEGVQVYESRVQYADGTLHDVIFNKAPFRNKDGSLGGLVGVILDITERKQAEDATRNAYRRIADILEFLPDATFVVDQEKRVIAWNRAIEEMTGVKKEEILGVGEYAYAVPFYGIKREILIDLLETEQGVLERLYGQVERKGETLFAVARIPGFRGGEERVFRSTAAPLYDADGRRVGGIQTLRDITELRLADEQRTKLAAQRHHSQMMESLLVQLGHDLKTPLTPLFALLPMVARQVKDPAVVMMLDICQKSANQIQGLTAKALQLVRLSSEEHRLEPVPTRVAAVAGSALAEWAPVLVQNGIASENGIDPALVIPGVPEQLTLLFENLIANASRYAKSTLTLSACREEGGVTVSVGDDGLGVERDHLERIFDEFFKSDPARHDLDTQGLGLAICKRIVLNHGGKIWAESPGKGQGTTIRFTLPSP